MAIKNIFVQSKTLEMETAALRASLSKLAADAREHPGDRKLFITYQTLKADIMSRMIRIMEMKKDMEEIIDAVPDSACRTLLQLRYINGETFEKISQIMCYEERHIYRLHKKALNIAEAVKNR